MYKIYVVYMLQKSFI